MKEQPTGHASARETAVRILYDVEEQGAYTNLALKKALWTQKHLDQRDKNLVTSLVYGTVKHQLHIDHILEWASRRTASRISPWVLAILRAGIFQILFLDKVPSFAAVNESVELSKSLGERQASGFINGVLRKVERERHDVLSMDIPPHVASSVPKRIYDLVTSFFGEETTKAFFLASLEEAPLTLRVNTWITDKETLKMRLKEEGVDSWDGMYAPDCLHTSGLHQIALLKSYRDGDYIIQDEGAMLSTEFLTVQKGQRVLDMCAAPGGKSTHAAQKAGLSGRVVARDIYDHKLVLIEENAQRMGFHNLEIQKKDSLEAPDGHDREAFDRVLLDAPCSGLGILRRKPDIKYHLNPKGLHELVQMQKKMILNGFDALKPGGVLVYTTCTINPRENIQVVDYLLRERSGAALDYDGVPENMSNLVGDDGTVQLWPHIHGTDGFFIARIVKRGES